MDPPGAEDTNIDIGLFGASGAQVKPPEGLDGAWAGVGVAASAPSAVCHTRMMSTCVGHVSVRLAVNTALVLAAGATLAATTPATSAPSSPIKHVVVIYQENHSFDNVLGRFCVQSGRCDGAVKGKLHDGTVIPLSTASDLVPLVDHAHKAQRTVIDGGRMDGFDLIDGCDQLSGYACYSQFDPGAIPNLSALAKAFVVSDATFETSTAASWVSHVALVASTTDGFYGSNPVLSKEGHRNGPGWGCDSFKDVLWKAAPWSKPKFVPSCIPDRSGRGPYRSSPVRWVPTIMDRMDAAGLTWKLYAGTGPDGKRGWPSGYYWQVCATFYACQESSQADNWVANTQILSDAAKGTLPRLALVTPEDPLSQHNGKSMLAGDDWIGRVVAALEEGPEWSSTAVFITYDDCGCFYDHVAPPQGKGIRVPMVIVSPYAHPKFTDSATASMDSVLAFIEHTFGLRPLSKGDAHAYDYRHAFNYDELPLPPVRMVETSVPPWELRWIARHPTDPNDPT
jgi:phospholipase C